jgi:hypothetical protein
MVVENGSVGFEAVLLTYELRAPLDVAGYGTICMKEGHIDSASRDWGRCSESRHKLLIVVVVIVVVIVVVVSSFALVTRRQQSRCTQLERLEK